MSEPFEDPPFSGESGWDDIDDSDTEDGFGLSSPDFEDEGWDDGDDE